jgi:hypothetical protein
LEAALVLQSLITKTLKIRVTQTLELEALTAAMALVVPPVAVEITEMVVVVVRMVAAVAAVALVAAAA